MLAGGDAIAFCCGGGRVRSRRSSPCNPGEIAPTHPSHAKSALWQTWEKQHLGKIGQLKCRK
ncbi:hypothetical protein H6F54_26365 [Coleofasciculus sp. FACHB-501]|nr:hypothetical protein [Coleofasciculus sp. FACHB-501]